MTTAVADPAAVWRIVDGHATYWAVAAALQSGVLDDPSAVRDERLAPVVDVLVHAGVLDDDHRRTPLGDLVVAMRGVVLGSPGVQENWLGLAGVLGGAEPPRPVDDDPGFRTALARATFPIQHELATRIAARLALPPDAEVVDVAVEPAPWAAAFGATVVAPDAPLPEADVVVLAHVCREGDARSRIADAVAAARTHVIVADYFTDAGDPDRARRAAVLGLTMLANTRTGTARPAAAYERWLTEAGAAAVELVDGTPAPHDVLIARTREAA